MINKSLLFLFIFFVGPLRSFVDIEELNRQHDGKLLVSQEQVNGLYQLMKDVHDLFALYNIEYWIQGGTLLGSLRHQGLMWWDDDFDINIKESDLSRFLALGSVLQQLDCYIEFTTSPSQFAIVRKSLNNERSHVIDIFLTKYENGITRYVLHGWAREGQPLYLYDSELYPLKSYQFGPLQLWGPQDSHVYLKCGFGNDYMEKVVLYNHRLPGWYYHCNMSDFSNMYQKCAMPSKVLEERVAFLDLSLALL